MSDDISRDSDGMDEQCRWCAEGGNLICCDFCHNAFCKKCILRNLGRKELSTIMDENNQWYCYICQPEPLLDLVTACNSVFENLEQLLQQNKKKIKVDSEKSSKVCDQTSKFSPKKNSSSCNGEEKNSEEPCSSSVPSASSALTVPKDMIKKTKKLIDTTSNMNSSYVKFLKQAAHNSEMTSAMKLRQLKAFKSVLADIKKAHLALEEDLNSEIQALDAVHKEKLTKELKITDAKSEMKMRKGEKSCNTEKKENLKLYARSSGKAIDGERTSGEEHKAHKSTSGEHKGPGRKDDPQYEPTNTSEDLDMDIVSVPSSVPEDIFESLESAMEVQSSGDYQGDGNSGTEPELESSSVKLNASSKDSRGNIKSKVTAKVRKELYVKLTPVSLSNSPIKGVDCQEDKSPQEKNGRKSSGVACSSEKCKPREENSDNEHSVEKDVSTLLEDSDLRRSPRVKTTPLRRQTEPNPTMSNSDEESNETVKEKQKLSGPVRKKDKRNTSDRAIDNPKPHKVPKAKQPGIGDQNSDSDEMLAVLKEASQMDHSSSSDTDINEPHTNHKSHTGKDDNGKRKRENSTSGSDFDTKKGESLEMAVTSKKKRQNYSESSNYDSELEREIKHMSRIGAARKSVADKKEQDFSEDEKQGKKVDNEGCERSKKAQEGSSADDTGDTEGRRGGSCSSAEGSVEKGRSGVEFQEMLCKRQQPGVSSDGAEKPPGKEGNVNSPEDKRVTKTKEKTKHLRTRTGRKVKGGSSDVTGRFSKKEQSDESSEGEKKQSRQRTGTKGKKTPDLKEEMVKREQEYDSSSDGTERFLEGKEIGLFSKGTKGNKNDSADREKKGKKWKDKSCEKKEDFSDSVDRLPGKGDSCDSSEEKKARNTVSLREKKQFSLPAKSSGKRPECSSSDTERSLKGGRCDSTEKRPKRIDLRERRNSNSKRNTKKVKSASSSSDAEGSSEDNKKQKKQRASAKKKTGNTREKKRNSLRATPKRKQADITSSSSDIGDDDQNSAGEESSDEQKIKPVTENLVLPSHTGFCQSSGDEALSKSVPVTADDDDDDNDPENRYDSIRKELKIITHPRHGRKQQQRNNNQVIKSRSSCLRKTRAQSSCKSERKARKWAKAQKPKRK